MSTTANPSVPSLAESLYGLATTGLVAAALGPALLYSRLSGKNVPGLFPGFAQRMGRYPDPLFSPSAHPRLWMHAVSVGEAGVAHAVFRDLSDRLPHLGLTLSTGTETGNAYARTLFGDRAGVVFAPLDFPPAVRSALSCARPHALVFIETELWPGWIWEARRRNIPIAVVNGRLSERSFKSYLAAGSLFRRVLSCVDVFSMAGAEDARRMALLSRLPRRVLINGNAKFDGLAQKALPGGREAARQKLSIPPDRPVLVCGSTRTGEEEILLSAFRLIRQQLPGTLLVLAPRHLSRLPKVLDLADSFGFSRRLWSRSLSEGLGPADVMVLDAMGELFPLYAAADLAFCGASLVPLGGQNVLEPAAWSVPVLFGPHTEDFTDARDLLLACEGGFVVTDAETLAHTALALLTNPPLLAAAGKNARSAVMRQQGAAARHAAVIADLI